MSKTLRTALSIMFLVAGIAAILNLPVELPSGIGSVDFRPYWTASYLLGQSQDFSDYGNIYRVQQELTGWTQPYPMYAWFAPMGNLILLPYTAFPFTQAAFFWMLTNISIVFFSAVLLWNKSGKRMWISLVAAFSFSMTLLSIIVGQVNTVVVLGLVLFLVLLAMRRDYAAGIGLALTTIKPHLVILTLPLLLLDNVRRRRWRVIAGFAGALFGLSLILFTLYPAWPSSFWKLVTSGMDFVRQSPTLPGLLVFLGKREWGQWIWVAMLLIAVSLYLRRGEIWDMRTLVDVSIIAGLIVSPIGWSYDQIMLLFPILRLLGWVNTGNLSRSGTATVVGVLILANVLTFYQRLLSPNEVWYIWVPIIIGMAYLFALKSRINPDQLPAIQAGTEVDQSA